MQRSAVPKPAASADAPDTYRAAGCVVLEASGNRLLLLHRPQRGEWRLPKGHVDPGESDSEAALRETREESGYSSLALLRDLGEQWVVFSWMGRVRRRRERYFLARLRTESQEARPPEDAAQFEVHWLTPAEAAGRLSYAAERNVLTKASAAMQGVGGQDSQAGVGP